MMTKWILLFLGVLIFTALAAPRKAIAHEDAWWIEQNYMAPPPSRQYTTDNGSTHCCSSDHCHRMTSAEVKKYVKENGRGITVNIDTPNGPVPFKTMEKGYPGAYPSIDGDYWWCRVSTMTGKVYHVFCIFYPVGGV